MDSRTPFLTDIAAAIEQVAPLSLQENYDNTGWQVLCDPAGRCSGVMVCVDVTPAVIAEAAARGMNMVLSHHPVLFRGQKRFAGETLVQQTVMEAIRFGISIYSCHTAIDSAPGGISAEMARLLNLTDVEVLDPKAGFTTAGLGVIGNLPEPLSAGEFAELVKGTFSTPVARCSRPAERLEIRRVGLCGGSGSEYIGMAAERGAQAFITSDTRHHDFVDHAREIFIVDIPHWNAESCARQLFVNLLSEAFPTLEVAVAETDRSPIIHL